MSKVRADQGSLWQGFGPRNIEVQVQTYKTTRGFAFLAFTLSGS